MFVSEFDQRTLRNALGAFATGVAIVTTVGEDGEQFGLTISSFNSVSLTPPLVLFSISKQALGFPTWLNAQRYAVNILGEHQQQLSNRFGRSSEDKWEGLAFEIREGGPVFDDVIAAFDCVAHSHFDGGDHEIFVGRVVALKTSATASRPPLLFYSGAYRKIESGIVGLPCHDALFW